MKVEQLAKLIWDELQGWGKLDAYFFAIVAGCLGADEETFKQAETFGSDPPEAFLNKQFWKKSYMDRTFSGCSRYRYRHKTERSTLCWRRIHCPVDKDSSRR